MTPWEATNVKTITVQYFTTQLCVVGVRDTTMSLVYVDRESMQVVEHNNDLFPLEEIQQLHAHCHCMGGKNEMHVFILLTIGLFTVMSQMSRRYC
jgi:hypothetical protein